MSSSQLSPKYVISVQKRSDRKLQEVKHTIWFDGQLSLADFQTFAGLSRYNTFDGSNLLK
jgi:hypothetical protein